MQGHKQLILGGARSGKSALAEQRALLGGKQVTYVATATAQDTEMQQRIAHHQQRRPDGWRLIEEPLALADVLSKEQGDEHCLIVDCLTLWLSNCLHHQSWASERESLLQVLPGLRGDVIFVSNETGLGVVPMGELSRQFVDEAGFLHQVLAQHCDEVTLTVAGLPMTLKSPRE